MRLHDQKHRVFRSRDLALDLDTLRSFLAVAEAGNVTKAAQSVGRAQSTLSAHIKRVEDVYGCPLFRRSGRGVSLSEQGVLVRGIAERILQLHASAQAEIAGAGARGTLRVGTMDDFAVDRLPLVLQRFAAGQPGIRLKIRTALSDELHAAIEAGELDIAVARRRASHAGGALLVREPLCWVGNGAMLDMIRSPALPLVMFRSGCLYRDLVTDALDQAGRSWEMVCTSGSLAGVCAATAAGLGLTVLAESTVPAGLFKLPDDVGLPSLPDTEVALFVRRNAQKDLIGPLLEAIEDAMAYKSEFGRMR